MKKTLRSLAIAALALPLIASAEITMTTVWMNGVSNGTANPIPGLDAGWKQPTPTVPSTATGSRFGIGKDGKILTTDHTKNAIIAWDGQNMSTFKQLPAVTDAKWNGTALATDDAGNVIFNFNFTDPDKSLQNWGVIGKDGQITEVTLSTPLSQLEGRTGRVDIISHIVGDVTSAEGGIGYSTNKGSGKIIMFHFKGNGSKVTSVTAKMSSKVNQLAELSAKYQIETWQPTAKYTTVSELLGGKNPADNFYLGLGVMSPNPEEGLPSIADGTCANFEEDGTFSPLTGIGNRFYPSKGLISLGGKNYIVACYVPGQTPIISAWCATMNIGLFDEDGNLIANWEGSSYANTYGSGTISVEKIDENNANIYIYVATTQSENYTSTTPGAYAAMIKVSYVNKGSGTQGDPYIIATADDLGNAWTKTVKGKLVYFKQVADIDMKDVTDYTALTGFDSEYDKSIYYDGNYHVIKNFAPVDRIAGTGANAYYNTTIFGTPSGTIKNLGVVDAQIETTWYEAGILGGFAGTAAHTATTKLEVENVYVTGTVDAKSEGALAGGFFGTSGQNAVIKNSFAHVEINGVANSFVGGLVGKVRANQWSPEVNLSIENAYASATVAGGTGTTSLIANIPTDEYKASLTVNNVVAFGSGKGSNDTKANISIYPDGSNEGIKAVQKWAAFNAGKMLNGLPALNWDGASSGIEDFEVETSDAPAVYYNLQGVEVTNPENGIYIVRRGNKVTKELIR